MFDRLPLARRQFCFESYLELHLHLSLLQAIEIRFYLIILIVFGLDIVIDTRDFLMYDQRRSILREDAVPSATRLSGFQLVDLLYI